jgi:hypothetical protein
MYEQLLQLQFYKQNKSCRESATKCIECETGSFEYEKFPITLMMMMQRAT